MNFDFTSPTPILDLVQLLLTLSQPSIIRSIAFYHGEIVILDCQKNTSLKSAILAIFQKRQYGSSIMLSKVSQKISVMKTKTLVFLLSSRQNMN